MTKEEIKNWQKNNCFKITVGLAFIVIAFSVGYYFIFYLPHKNNDDRIFVKETDCQKYAPAIIKGINDANTYNKNTGLNLVTVSFGIIFYSPKQNTCLYTTFNDFNSG